MKQSSILSLGCLLTAVMAFTPMQQTQQRYQPKQQQQKQHEQQHQQHGKSMLLWMGGGSAFASTLAGKQKTVESVKTLLDTSYMIFSVPASSVTVGQQQKLRRAMPEGTSVKVVKNNLMERALVGTEFEPANGLLKGTNMWIFVEEDIKGTIEAYNAFLKDTGKKDTHQILGGVLEGVQYDTEGIDAIGKLPSKQELYARIAGSIKAVPTKVARVIKAPSSKLARAIKLATMPEENNDE